MNKIKLVLGICVLSVFLASCGGSDRGSTGIGKESSKEASEAEPSVSKEPGGDMLSAVPRELPSSEWPKFSSDNADLKLVDFRRIGPYLSLTLQNEKLSFSDEAAEKENPYLRLVQLEAPTSEENKISMGGSGIEGNKLHSSLMNSGNASEAVLQVSGSQCSLGKLPSASYQEKERKQSLDGMELLSLREYPDSVCLVFDFSGKKMTGAELDRYASLRLGAKDKADLGEPIVITDPDAWENRKAYVLFAFPEGENPSAADALTELSWDSGSAVLE